MKETKKPRGAPKKTNPADSRLEIRCTTDEKTKWDKAAKASKFSSLSAWIKHLANKSS